MSRKRHACAEWCFSMPFTDPASPLPAASIAGWIDIHSHLLPGVDDGCQDLEESLASIAQLQQAGFVGSICTPHVFPQMFPQNTAEHIRGWTAQLAMQLRQRGIAYPLWPGGELRLFDGVIDWLKTNEVPTLAGSRYVLTDFWEPVWPKWVDKALDWLLSQGYQPILAHPERLAMAQLPQHLEALTQRGVLLQGNVRCMTGEDGYLADQWVRRFLAEKRYAFLALDAHRPDTLASRLDGLTMVTQEFGPDTTRKLLHDTPRQIVTLDA